jgi:putative protease
MDRGNPSMNGTLGDSAPPTEPDGIPRLALGVPELVAPAGDWDCLKAAVENGADAVYFGLGRHNARLRAANFTEADLPQIMEFLHRRGVKGYVTFNTLVFEDEMAGAEQSLRALIGAGVDAVMVQDVGLCRLIRRLSPDFPIHASTQMTITSAAGVAFARELGCSKAVLARECSIPDISQMANPGGGTPPDDDRPETAGRFPLEVFIHGALCVAYSGQCLTSEALGGRSANRGECAQACRMPYELIADGQPVPLGDRRYLLSPQDLAGLELLPELIRAGVASLKIEGRLKRPEYVANITRIYREALDRLTASRAEAGADPRPTRYAMEMAFSRGLHTGWLRGVNHQALVHGRFGKKRGVYLGEVSRVQGDRVFVRLEAPLKPGDGVVFDAGKPEEPEEGGRVYEVRHLPTVPRAASESALAFGRGDLDLSRIHPGHKLWKTSDPELERRWRQSFAGDTPRFQRPIDLEVRGQEGVVMTLVARDELGHEATVASAMPLRRAARQPLTTERLREQLGRLGGTALRLGRLENRLDGDVILPVSELNQIRRQAVALLESRRAQPKRWTIREGGAGTTDDGTAPETGARPGSPSAADPSQLIVLVRNLPQLEAALNSGTETLYCDFEDPKRYREAVRQVREAGSCRGPERTVWVAPPRIFKMGEEWMLKQVRSCDADGYLVRNYDHLRFFAEARCVGDYSLNVANALSAEQFKHRFALERLTASYDLNAMQLEALLRAAPPEWFEVTIHQHMPMFHMDHCVFCAFLSSGTDYTNCGRPCDTRDVRLRDRVGAEHPVKADAGCRNTVFNARAQTGAEYVRRLRSLGARHFRVEFVDESPDQVAQTISQYRQLLRGEITGAALWRHLRLRHQLGVTRGPLDKR